MAPARIGDEELTAEEVERLGARRLAEIVVKHCYQDDGLLQTVRIALAASAPGDALVETRQPRSTPSGWIGDSMATAKAAP
jgi:hypothetical protein